MALNTKKHEKCLFSLSACSFIHFPASRGAFSSPERAPSPLQLPNWTKWGSGRRNQWGALGGVGMLLSSPQLLASVSLLSNAIPARLTRSHTNTSIHTDTHTRGGILASINGPHGRQKRALSHWRHWGWLAFLSGGMYVCTHTHTHTRFPKHTSPCSLPLKRYKQTPPTYVHMDPHTCRNTHPALKYTHRHTVRV